MSLEDDVVLDRLAECAHEPVQLHRVQLAHLVDVEVSPDGLEVLVEELLLLCGLLHS